MTTPRFRRMAWALALLAWLAAACGQQGTIFQPDDTAPPPDAPTSSGTLQPVPIRALVGPVRAKDGIFYDATGPRRVIGYSDFPALRIFQDDPAEAERTLAAARAAGWQYVRIAFALAENETDYGGYWRGAHVHPETTTKRVLVPFAKLAQRYGIRLHLFGGYSWCVANPRGCRTDEIAFIRWMAETLRDEGLAESVVLFEWRNEYVINAPWRGGPESYSVAREAIELWKRTVGSPTTMGSPGEDDPAIARSVRETGADVAAIDFERGLPGYQLMKRAHRAYYDGRYKRGYLGASLFATEPTGPQGVGGDVTWPLDDPQFVYGLASVYAVSGQAFTFFNGPAVRHRRPIDSTFGFYELPRLLAHIPEDIGTYVGPSWFTKGTRFVTVLAEQWAMHAVPPRPVRAWSLVTLGGVVLDGIGPTVNPPAGWKAAIITGEWQ